MVKELTKHWITEQGHSSKRVEETKKALDVVGLAILSSPNTIEIQNRAKELQQELKEGSRIEKADLKQRSRVNRLKMVYFNPSFSA